MKKKIIIAALGILLVIGAVGTFWGNSIANAATGLWKTCPYGLVNDPYPGRCFRYVDTNNDGICDRSQFAPVITPAATAPETTGGSGTPSVIATPTATETPSTAGDIVINGFYHFFPILLVTGTAYVLTWALAKRKVIRQPVHRKIWNVLLLISAIISSGLGLLLILNLEFRVNLHLWFNMLYWHVETSIVMGLICIFHVLWHWKYFWKIFKGADKV
jgi:hypothetical protein